MTLTLDRRTGRRARTEAPDTGAIGETQADEPRSAVRWWAQVVLVLAFYALYTFVRGQFGSAAAGPERAAANARIVIDIEQWLGIYNERELQQWVLSIPGAIRAANIFYGMLHFAAPAAVLVLLHRRDAARFRHWRNTLAGTTALALVGFSLFPLMPPRLLCACALGSGVDAGFVDTLARTGGLWSFGSHGVGAVSNQYAAMPSLHFAWALWCACAAAPVMRSRWARIMVIAYPVVTLFVIVVTANHFWLDAVGGAVVLACGAGLAALAALAARLWRPLLPVLTGPVPVRMRRREAPVGVAAPPVLAAATIGGQASEDSVQ